MCSLADSGIRPIASVVGAKPVGDNEQAQSSSFEIRVKSCVCLFVNLDFDCAWADWSRIKWLVLCWLLLHWFGLIKGSWEGLSGQLWHRFVEFVVVVVVCFVPLSPTIIFSPLFFLVSTLWCIGKSYWCWYDVHDSLTLCRRPCPPLHEYHVFCM